MHGKFEYSKFVKESGLLIGTVTMYVCNSSTSASVVNTRL